MVNIPKNITQRARAIIIANGKILLINRIKKDESYWVIPGGKVELGESQKEAVKRECVEELGITVRVNKLFIERPSTKPGMSNHYEFFYLCDITSGKVGTGQGPEFQPENAYEGKYKISWVDFKKFLTINLKPEEIKEKIIRELS